MKAFVKLGLAAAFLMGVQACGKSDDDKTSQPTFQGAAYAKVGEGDLTASDTSLSGTGKVVFDAPLAGVNEGAHFKVTAALDDGGELRLVMFAANDLNGGLELVVNRAGDVLTAKLVKGAVETDLSAAFEGMAASEPVTIQVDLHNDETPAHVLVWSGAATSFDEASALFNSEEDGDAPGNGEGSFWGVALVKATLTAASTDDTQFEGH